ncbi:MAG: HAD family phosphatase [Cohaesibacter sp.]|nr:HAD family phosphatase [Cohaesibacter sp.]MCV6602035.1 HAD family phosphatase [Cohaesibacter sp.]
MLVIFDFDGTLVDSEIMWAQATSEVMQEEDIDMSVETYNAQYAGMNSQEIIAHLEEELEQGLSHDIAQRIQDKAEKKLENVKAIQGVHEMLDQLDYARCLCSNSDSDYLCDHMRSTGLWDRFRPYIYSATEVGSKAAKPDPNVFLHAATSLEMDAKDCYVIEDSFHGVQAAVAAGMRVIGFIGGAHSYPGHGEHLMDAGAETVIHRFEDLPATLEALKIWQDQ